MSSGNPFRASLALHPTAPAASSPEATVPRASFTTAETTDPRPDGAAADVPVRTKKHVRIESTAISIPPQPQPQPDLSSPDDSPQTSFAPQSSQYAAPNYVNSPAGYSNSSPGAYTREPGRSSSYDMGAADGMASSNTASSNMASGTSFPALSPSVVPANPFAKTLANMEPGGEDRASAEGGAAPATGNSRASLDVESFKNMLLTGKPYPKQTTQPPQPPGASAAVVESGSSSTDTSSLSRQSLLEPAHEAPGESPRTSYEMARSDEDDLGPQRTRSKRKPPPAPAHRHGKLVSPRQPQTVPFDSFNTTEAPASPVTRPRNVSDTSTNKPLPPTPPILTSPPSADTLEKALPSPIFSPLSRSNSAAKKKPPPVPLARRQSQLRHSSAGTDNRSSRSSSLTLSSQQSLDAPTSNPLSPSAENAREALERGIKSPPPPPPSRHGARLSDIGSSSPSAPSPPPQRNSSVRTAASSSSRRSTLEGFNDTAPTSGSASTSKRSSRVLSSSGDTAGSITMPPPPPPPRGARRAGSGSARSSLDTQRPALHSLASSASAVAGVEFAGRRSAEMRRGSNDASGRLSGNGARRTSTDGRRTSTDLRRTSLEGKRRASGASGVETGYEHGLGEEWALVSPREEAEDLFESVEGKDGAGVGGGGGGGEGGAEQRKDSSSILDDMERFQREIDELRERYKGVG